jgi:hypothetical protein
MGAFISVSKIGNIGCIDDYRVRYFAIASTLYGIYYIYKKRGV